MRDYNSPQKKQKKNKKKSSGQGLLYFLPYMYGGLVDFFSCTDIRINHTGGGSRESYKAGIRKGVGKNMRW